MRSYPVTQPACYRLYLPLAHPASIFVLLPLLCFDAYGDDGTPALVANPSFEEAGGGSSLPAGWRGDTAVYRRDTEVARTGSASLRFENDDPARYRLANQRVPLAPGRTYRFSGWVKTKDLTGPDSGATFCIEWSDKDGKWLGGSYPYGIAGTKDWTFISGIAAVPEEAGTCTLSCYVRRGMTGTAWFDDVFRSMAWQCIAEGATGLIFYSWYDLKRNPDATFDEKWGGLKRLAEEIDRMAPVILSVEPAEPIVVGDGTPPEWLHYLVRRHGGKLYLVAVNNGDGEGEVAFQLPAAINTVRETSENRVIESTGTVFRDRLAPLAVHLYEIE